MYGYWLELTVSDHNPFRDKIEVPIEACTYNIAVGGYFILIKELPSPDAAEAATYLLWLVERDRVSITQMCITK